MEFAATLRERTGPLLLLVEHNSALRSSIAAQLQARGCRVALARSIGEALEMIDDLRFIESEVDGLVVDYRLPDGLGCRIVQDFRREFPNTPAALVIDEEDVTMRLWTRTRGIALMNKPTLWNELHPWLERFRIPA
jgi:DNA-binding response OmpR family regulator